MAPLYIITEEFKPVEFTEQDYERFVQNLKRYYPKIGRRVYKTPTKTWKQVYEEMLEIIKKENGHHEKNPKETCNTCIYKCHHLL
jgi:hypothetical protein